MENLDKNLLEKLAEAAYEIFYEDLILKKHKYGYFTKANEKDNNILKPYVKLSEKEKESNRNNIRDIPNKLSSIGYKIVKNQDNETPIIFTIYETEKLAKMEHIRWMQEKLNNGWQYAKKTDRAKKLHKSLIPWGKLSEDEKEKDRSLVKGIPKILLKAGYGMIKQSKKT